MGTVTSQSPFLHISIPTCSSLLGSGEGAVPGSEVGTSCLFPGTLRWEATP